MKPLQRFRRINLENRLERPDPARRSEFLAEIVGRLCETPGVLTPTPPQRFLCSRFPDRNSSVSRRALLFSISPPAAKHRSNSSREDLDATLERAQGKYATVRRSAEFADIHRKQPQPHPSLARGRFAGLRRSVRASVLIQQIVVPLPTSIQTRAWFLSCP